MNKPLIIIADPNEARAEIVGAALGESLQVLRYRTAEEAYPEIRSRRPAAVVIDFPLPLEGVCLSRALNEDPRTSSIPVVAFSGWDFPRTRDKAREYGCAVFVPQSDGAEELARAVNGLLEQEPGAVA